MWHAFQWLAGDIGRPAEEIEAVFEGWERVDLPLHGAPFLAILRKGTEIHAVLAPEWRKRIIPKGFVTEAISGLLEHAGGMLTTRVLRDARKQLYFVRRLGFRHTWSDEKFHYFALTSAPFGRATP